MLGAIEAGGTKFICAVGTEDGNIVDRIRFPTKTPEETMPEVIRFFKGRPLKGLGIGSFGPIDIDKNSQAYGHITSTPKPGWSNFPFVQTMRDALDVPIEFHTDVSGAALGELIHGAAVGLDSCLYITVGTGIGAGAAIKGNLLEGLTHPEMGHILVRKHPEDSYAGNCPYHGDCLEGLAAGPAIEHRWGKKGHELADITKVWKIEAYYLAQALMQYVLVLSPQKIIMGGGVMKQEHLFPLVREQVQKLLNGYVSFPEITERIEEYIVPPGLGDDAGIIGALKLARQAAGKED
ncbi:MAG TPA: ROK family protein [Bacillaceae bacterium]